MAGPQGPSGPSGIQPLSGFTNPTPEATAEQRLGGMADERHAILGEVAKPYPWEVYPGESHGPYGLENGLFGMDVTLMSEPAGYLNQDPTSDQTPITHAAPWPKGVPQSVQPDAVSQRRIESAGIHSSNLGASRESLYEPTLNPVQDDWRHLYETDPGITFPQMVPIPGQIMTGGSGGWGSRDRIQSMARQNSYGYDSAHMMRRYAAGPIPGNYMWLQPGSRPLHKSIAGPSQIPVGPTSPFYGQDPGESYDAQGAALRVIPTAYQPSSDPSLAASYPLGEAAPTMDFW